MPVLIQDFASGNYLQADGGWTGQFSKALKFEQLLRAWEAIDDHKLSGVRIVLEPRKSTDASETFPETTKRPLFNPAFPSLPKDQLQDGESARLGHAFS